MLTAMPTALRRALPLLLIAVLTGCATTPRRPGAPRVATPLVEGDGVWRLRYNPPPCLADQPELHAEAETPAGWERVALESADAEVDHVAALLTRFGRAPRGVVPVQGELTANTRSWAGHHAARVLRVAIVDPEVPPPPPSEEAEPAPEAEPEPAADHGIRARSRHSASCASPRAGR